MLTSARICPHRQPVVLRALATCEKRDAHCMAGGVPIC
jgi:hypothetical protein